MSNLSAVNVTMGFVDKLKIATMHMVMVWLIANKGKANVTEYAILVCFMK